MPKAPRQLPSLPPPNRANPTARANSKLDKTWGQGQRAWSPAATDERSGALLRDRSTLSALTTLTYDYCGTKRCTQANVHRGHRKADRPSAHNRRRLTGPGRHQNLAIAQRLWRSLKHEDIYLKGYADGREAKAGIANWIAFYNNRRLHQALGYRAPMAIWRERMLAPKAVDMVDNADALTTCPPQLQQTESLAA
ncbi:integrase core domain-containing protein [Bradyrhizobium barranii]|uniref:integrase core domain-containing protein n=1 Tax=Bradyrhizobium barranii TaxID=2992140 RepID=UPI0024C0C32A|nr:integrase core domain-containing protein [Bradyrhizobium japonicum]